MKAASSEHKKHRRTRPARKCLALYDSLLRVFKTARSNGYRVDLNWLWSKARVLYRELTNDPGVTVCKHVTVNFIKRNNIGMRAHIGQKIKEHIKNKGKLGLCSVRNKNIYRKSRDIFLKNNVQ